MSEPQLSRQQPLSECLTDQLERPSLDNRSYKVIRLANKLEALLIHDPDTDKASAALDVNAGAFSDDHDLPGMAHAVEHLLFMGTEKYPKENEYNQYLAAHSGYSNAFTAATSTNYYFECAARRSDEDQAALKDPRQASPLFGALDRFAQFFISPLFLEETLDRELRAVDSENKKNLQNDGWRLMQLSKSLANPKHPYCRFSTGNLKTLRDEPVARGVKIRDEFIRFHREQYSANRMKLVVLGRESTTQLQEWVEELFTAVVNKDLAQNRWDNVVPYTEKQLKTLIFAKPVMDMRNLEITFQYQDEEQMYDSQPGHYLSHLIGHEGPGSILAYLKAQGWANELSAGAMPICPGSALFSISVRLTPDGLKFYTEIVRAVFAYISILREAGPQEWIFNEVKEMSEVDFRFKQKAAAHRTTSGLSQVMQKPLPRDRLLSGSSVVRKFNPEAIRSGLECLNPDNFRITIVSQQTLPGTVERERWYGTEYTTQEIPASFLEELREAWSGEISARPYELGLPSRNEFIPSRLEVERKEVSTPSMCPKLIRNDSGARLWFKKDDQFWVPKANLYVTLRSPICNLSARNLVMAQLLTEIVQDSLNEFSYSADIAGLSYSITSYSAGISVVVSGYNDKMHVLLEKVVSTLRNLEVKATRFEIIKERVIRGLKNFEYSTPYQQVGHYTRWLGSEKAYTNEERLEALHEVTLEDIRLFRPQLLRQMHVEAMAHGNIFREDALRMLDVVVDNLKPLPLPVSQWPIRRALELPEGCNFYYSRPLKDASNVNHCIQYVLQIGNVEDRKRRALLLLFAQMTSEPAFDQLRTKEQLGYVVFSGSLTQLTTAAYQVLIQSERSPTFLESRIEHFLATFGHELEAMSSSEFEGHKRSVTNKLLERLKNLVQESNRYWGHISDEFYYFDENQEDADLIRSLTKEDVLAFYEQYINPSSPHRAKMSVHLLAKGGPPSISGSETADEDGSVAVEDVHEFRASLPLSRGARPRRELSMYEDLESKL